MHKSRITYSDYAALICYFDQSKRMRMANDHPDQHGAPSLEYIFEVGKEFRAECEHVRQEVIDFIGQSAPADFSFLYRPCWYTALGHSDDVALTAIDDLRDLVRLTSRNSTVENSILAFCPRLDSFTFNSDKPNPFRELKYIVSSLCTGEAEKQEPDRAGEICPLCSVTAIKFNAFAILGHSLHFLHSTMQLVINTVQNTLTALATATDLEINSADLLATRCLILDPQGAEDLLLVTLTSNYTIAACLVEAVSNLSFGELFDLETASDAGNPTLLEKLNSPALGELHRAFATVGTRMLEPHSQVTNVDAVALSGNHIFSNLYTTLGFSLAALRNPGDENLPIRGFVRAQMALNINPGHVADVDKIFSEVGALDFTSKWLQGSTNYRLINFGRYDEKRAVKPLSPESNSNVAELRDSHVLVHTRTLLKYLGELLRRIPGRREAGRKCFETGLLDLTSHISVPIPNRDDYEVFPLLYRSVNDSHLPGMHILEEIRRSLTRPSRGPVFDHEKLIAALTEVQFPWAGRESISYLLNEFLSCVADPAYVESVLDLFECFTAISSAAIADKSLADLEEHHFRPGQQISPRLESFVSGLQNAIIHRISRLAPEREVRDNAVDFRGGLNKLIAAGDVPLKCSMAIFRRTQQVHAGGEDELHFKRRIAGVSEVRFSPRAETEYSALPFSICQPGRNNTTWRSLMMNVRTSLPHLFNPEELVAHFHEIGDVLFDVYELGDESTVQQILKDAVSKTTLPARGLHERFREVFAELLTELFVFRDDLDLFITHAIARYYLISGSFKEDANSPEDAAEVVKEWLYRLFLVAYPVSAVCLTEEVERWPCETASFDLDCHTLEDAFVTFANTHGPKLVDYLVYSPGGLIDEEALRKKVRDSFETTCEVMRLLWSEALSVFQSCLCNKMFDSLGRMPSNWRSLGAELDSALTNGTPFSRKDYNEHVATWKAGCTLSGLALTSALLREYVRRTYGTATLLSSENQSDLVVMKKESGMCANTFSRRRSLVKEQITVFKMLWDVSSDFRSRRLLEMMSIAWPDIINGSSGILMADG